MLRYSVLLAKVMSQANEHDTPGAQVRRGPGNGAANLGEPSRAAPASRTHRSWADRARSLRNPAGRPGRAGAARRDDSGGAGRPREGSAALHDARHFRARGSAARTARAARIRPAAGNAHGDRRGPGTGEPGPAPEAAGSRSGGASRLGWPQTFRSLSTRNYRLFAAGQVVSNTGTWMQRVAQDWLVLQL